MERLTSDQIAEIRRRMGLEGDETARPKRRRSSDDPEAGDARGPRTRSRRAVDASRTASGPGGAGSDPPPDGVVQAYDRLISSLESEVTFLRKELERKDLLLAGLMQRVPQLQAPQDGAEAEPAGGIPEDTWEAPGESRGRWWKPWTWGRG